VGRPVRFAAFIASFPALIGCARPDASTDVPPAPTTEHVEAPPPSVALAAPFLPPVEPNVPMPRPRRQRLAAAVALNGTCTSCHEEETKEWRGSYHQRANIDPAYVQAFAIEPSLFCRACHAPEADPSKEPPLAVSELGVACVTCHVTEDGIVLAAERSDKLAVSPAPHPLRRSRAFAHQGGCANCHEFHFPMPGGDDDAFFMQTTAREHLRSPAAEKACADCHMPIEKGHRSHSFAHVRDPAWLRKNLDVTAEKSDDGLLRIKLVQPNPGHDAPTGDLFRRYEVGYEILGLNGEVLHRDTTYLARHFELVPGKPGRTLTRDNRVTSEARIVEMDIPPNVPATARFSWWVTYQRVATVGKGTNPNEAVIESSVKLHSGILPNSASQPNERQP
jgi:Cytochrome c554 and c-prime